MCIRVSLTLQMIVHQEYFVAEEVEGFYVLDNPLKLPWSTFIGVLGMLGDSFIAIQRNLIH